MITLNDYQLLQLADHLRTLPEEEVSKVKYLNGQARYHITHGITGKVLISFEDPAYESLFVLRFSEYITAQSPGIIAQEVFSVFPNNS